MTYHLRLLARQISGNVRIPLIFAIIIEAISSIQILHIILKCIFKFNLSTIFSFAAFSREFTSYFGAIQVFDPISSEADLKGIWFGLIGYLIFHIILFGVLILNQVIKSLEIPETLWNLTSILYTLHSRLFFFPIHYYLTGVIETFSSCNYIDKENFYCKEMWLIPTVIAIILNFVIAGIAEVFLYNVNKTKNGYAIKNNYYNQVVLLQKTLGIIAVFFYGDNGEKNTFGAIVHLLLTLLLFYLLFTKLPFYETLLMKIKVVFTGITMASAIILLISIFSVEEIKLEIPWLLLTVLMAKFSIVSFNLLLNSVLNGSIGTPERAIHFFLLMKEFNFGHVNPSVHRRKYPYKAIIVNGSFARYDISTTALKKEKPTKEAEQEIYRLALEKLQSVLNKFPKSVPLLLFLAQIYLKKLGNVSQAVVLVKRASDLNLSITMRNSVEEFDSILKRIYSKQYLNNEENLSLLDYFAHRKIGNMLKDDIQLEMLTHLEFWQELQKQKIDAKRAYDLSRKIDTLSKKIHITFKLHLWGFSRTVCNTLLIYRTYLERIQEMPNEARKITKKFFSISTNPLVLHPFDVYSSDKAVAILSLNRDKIGTIIDVSGSIQTMFQIDKSKIIGRSLDVLLPEIFAKSQIEFIKEVYKVITHQINHKVKSYGKNQNGDLFELEAQIQLYPDLEEGVKLMILFTKKSSTLPIIVLGNDGTILECSESLRRSFELRDFLAKGIKFQEVCQDFNTINTAFNKVYNANHEYNKERKSETFSRDQSKGTKLLVGKETSESMGKSVRATVIEEKEIIVIDIERATEICNSFIEGSKLTFINPVGQSKFDWEAHIEPYILGNNFYKIVTLKTQDIMKQFHFGSSIDFNQRKSFTITTDNNDLFADEFPIALEREEDRAQKEHKHHSKLQYYVVKDTSDHPAHSTGTNNTPNKFLTIKTVSLNHRGSDMSISKLTIPSIPAEGRAILNQFTSFDKPEKTAESFREEEMAKNNELSSSNTPVKVEPLRQAMSVTSYTTTSAHAIKALKRVFSQSSTYPLARNSFLTCSALNIILIILAVVFYLSSKDSIDEYEGNIDIINGASQRLSDAMASLQAVTRYYLNITGLGADDIDNIRDTIASSALKMLDTNNILNQELSSTLQKSQFYAVYNADINLWEPCGNFTSNNKPITTFQATTLLYSRYHSLRDTPRSCSNINAGDDITYVMNNTANDYLVSSENLITATRGVLEESVDSHVLNLELILIGQSLVLGMLCVFLIAIIYILVQSYKRLLRALVKIDQSQVNLRVQEMQKLKGSIEGDLEGKKFSADALNSLDESVILMKEHTKKKVGRTNTFANRDDRFMLKSLAIYLVKFVIVSIVFIALPTVLFYTSLATSMSDYNKLDKLDDQLIVTSNMQYQVDLLMSNFYIEMMFENITSMLIRNNLPKAQLPLNLQIIQTLHEELVNVFLKNEGDFTDPFIQQLLSDNLCSIFDESTTDAKLDCEIATKGGKTGLVELDVSYITTSSYYLNEYIRNPTFANADNLVEPYSEAIRPTLQTLIRAYLIINTHLLDKVQDVIDIFLVQQEIYFVAILGTILLSACITYFLSIKRFREVDMGRGMILKMIPYVMITENRALEFYLKKDFSKKKYGLQTMRR